MRQATVVGLALALAGCATTQPRRSATPAPTTAQSRSATATQEPALCIVDGKESSCQDVLQMPRDRIERVEVLKGSAATALYGSRFAAGVVVVTTKR
ncbi:MAG: TonB-dependent receptor plug domain-containing protein [Gemmatimonadaceae bacterium]